MENKERLIKLLGRAPDTMAAYMYIWLKHCLDMPEGIVVDEEFCAALIGDAVKHRFETVSIEELAKQWGVAIE